MFDLAFDLLNCWLVRQWLGQQFGDVKVVVFPPQGFLHSRPLQLPAELLQLDSGADTAQWFGLFGLVCSGITVLVGELTSGY